MAKILPITRGPFDPETLALATSVYDRAVVDISSTPDVLREVIAKHIIQLVSEGERDPNVLHERALASAGISR